MRDNENPTTKNDVSIREFVEEKLSAISVAEQLEFKRIDEKTVLLCRVYDDRMLTMQTSLIADIEKQRELRELWITGWEKQWTEHKETLRVKLEGMNELRSQISSERTTYVQRDAFDERIAAMDKTSVARTESISSKSETVLAQITKRIDELDRARSNMDGRMLVLGVGGSTIIAIAISLVSAAIQHVFK